MNQQNLENLLKSYAREMSGFARTLTVEELIDSHRTLRALNQQRADSWKKELEKAVKEAVEAAEKAVFRDYIKLEKLASMEAAEIAALIEQLKNGNGYTC